MRLAVVITPLLLLVACAVDVPLEDAFDTDARTVFSSAREPGCTPSELWGLEGELTSTSGRLPDFSYAGYRAGERRLPRPAVTHDIRRDFGARGDGVTDDTEAFRRAIREVSVGVVLIPKGTYRISGQLSIRRSNLVFRGESRSGTTLAFTRSWRELCAAEPRRSGCDRLPQAGESPWTRDPAFIQIGTSNRLGVSTPVLAAVASNAARGTRALRLDRTVNQLRPGDWVLVAMSDPEGAGGGSLLQHLVADTQRIMGTERFGAQNILQFASRVTSVSGRDVMLERALPVDVRRAWSPRIFRFTSGVESVGIESLTVSFPHAPYAGHHQEDGYNAIGLSQVSNCWLRDLEIVNADNNVALTGTFFTTVDGVTVKTSRSRGYRAGHYGFRMSHSADNLLTNLDLQDVYQHEISVSNYSHHNVYSNVVGVNLAMDHHHAFNHANLFTNIDVGAGTRTWQSGGNSDVSKGPNTGARATFWNIHGRSTLSLPPSTFGGMLNFVAVQTRSDVPLTPEQRRLGWHHEPIPRTSFCTPNLHREMLRRRLRADPDCETGIANGELCCASSCGQCGGTGCGTAACCGGAISASGQSCETSPPPCVMAP